MQLRVVSRKTAIARVNLRRIRAIDKLLLEPQRSKECSRDVSAAYVDNGNCNGAPWHILDCRQWALNPNAPLRAQDFYEGNSKLLNELFPPARIARVFLSKDCCVLKSKAVDQGNRYGHGGSSS